MLRFCVLFYWQNKKSPFLEIDTVIDVVFHVLERREAAKSFVSVNSDGLVVRYVQYYNYILLVNRGW